MLLTLDVGNSQIFGGVYVGQNTKIAGAETEDHRPVAIHHLKRRTGAERTAAAVVRGHEVFGRWTDLIAQRFVADGIAADQADELAMSATAALEGAIVLARVRRDLAPLDAVYRQLRSALLAATEGKELPR